MAGCCFRQGVGFVALSTTVPCNEGLLCILPVWTSNLGRHLWSSEARIELSSTYKPKVLYIVLKYAEFFRNKSSVLNWGNTMLCFAQLLRVVRDFGKSHPRWLHTSYNLPVTLSCSQCFLNGSEEQTASLVLLVESWPNIFLIFKWNYLIITYYPSYFCIILQLGSSEYLNICNRRGAFFINIFYWSIVDLQCHVSFCCIAKWFSYTYISFFSYPFPLWFIIGYGI